MCASSHCLNHFCLNIVCVIICGCVVMCFNCLLIVLFYIESHLLLGHCTCMLNSLMCVCRIFPIKCCSMLFTRTAPAPGTRVTLPNETYYVAVVTASDSPSVSLSVCVRRTFHVTQHVALSTHTMTDCSKGNCNGECTRRS